MRKKKGDANKRASVATSLERRAPTGETAGPMRFLLAAVLALAACRQNDDPEGAKELFARIDGFRTDPSWHRAPGFATRKPSFTAHADAVEIWVNAPLAAALAGPAPITVWPDGAIVAKEGFRKEQRSIVAVMEKRGGEWYWAEYDSDGEPLFSGKPKICVDCHDNRAQYSDWLYSIELPR
jgi:hypothetical protein